MGKFEEVQALPESSKPDYIRIDRNKKKISFELTLHRFTDKDTLQVVLYMPSLDITSYGETNAKASEMLQVTVDEFFTGLSRLSPKHFEVEMRKIGFKQAVRQNKQFSKAFVDINGTLQNFNAVDDKVEQLTLTAA